MGEISYEDKTWIETLRKLGFGFRTIVAEFPGKGWKRCSLKAICNLVTDRYINTLTFTLMSVDQQQNESQVAVGRKQHEQREMLVTLSC